MLFPTLKRLNPRNQRVFISHGGKDEEWKKLCELVEAEGYDSVVFEGPENASERSIPRRVRGLIRSSHLALICISAPKVRLNVIHESGQAHAIRGLDQVAFLVDKKVPLDLTNNDGLLTIEYERGEMTEGEARDQICDFLHSGFRRVSWLRRITLGVSLATAVLGTVAGTVWLNPRPPILSATAYLTDDVDGTRDLIAGRVESAADHHAAFYEVSDCGEDPVELVPLDLGQAGAVSSAEGSGHSSGSSNVAENILHIANRLALEVRPDSAFGSVNVVMSEPDGCGGDFDLVNTAINKLGDVRLRLNVIGVDLDEASVESVRSQMCKLDTALLVFTDSSEHTEAVLRQIAGQELLFQRLSVLDEIVNIVRFHIAAAAVHLRAARIQDAKVSVSDGWAEFERTDGLFKELGRYSADGQDSMVSSDYSDLYELDVSLRGFQRDQLELLDQIVAAIQEDRTASIDELQEQFDDLTSEMVDGNMAFARRADTLSAKVAVPNSCEDVGSDA